MQASTCLAAGSCALVVVPATKSRDGGSWTPTVAQGGAASEMQLDSAHRTTGVSCRLCSRQRGGRAEGDHSSTFLCLACLPISPSLEKET